MNNLIRRNDALDQRLKATDTNVEGSIQALITASKSNRKLINWVIVSMIVEAIVAFVSVFAFVKASQNHSTLITNCNSGNEFRATEKSLWNFILSIPSETKPTPEQQKQLEGFKVFLEKTFAPRDCTTL